MNEWFFVFWITLLLAAIGGGIALEAANWTSEGRYYSTHDDPSPGPNALF